jgi:hypothetical protein
LEDPSHPSSHPTSNHIQRQSHTPKKTDPFNINQRYLQIKVHKETNPFNTNQEKKKSGSQIIVFLPSLALI